jgi:hypothetical protein
MFVYLIRTGIRMNYKNFKTWNHQQDPDPQ